MKILVTGHKGFVGSHLFKCLKKEGHEVSGYDEGSAFVYNNPVDLVFHLAAYPKALESIKYPYTALKNIRTRLERTNNFNKTTVEYQSAVDDIRGTIREVPYIDCWIWHFN